MLFSFLPWWIAYVNENWDKIVFIKNNDENNTATTRVTFLTLFFLLSLCDHWHISITLTLTRLLCALCWNRKTWYVSSSQATQISVSFVCVYASSTLPFIVVSNRFSHCLDHWFRLFRSLFKSISIDYKTLEINYFVFETFYCCLFGHLWVVLDGPLI